MIFPTATLLAALTLAPLSAFASPVETMGSKHVVYLASCVNEDCPLGLCDPSDVNINGAAYFRNGPPSSASSSATAIGTTSSSNFEGSKRSIRVGSEGSFAANIPTTAKTSAKGDLVGDATLTGGSLIGDGESEPFVCFKDGSTKFRATYQLDRYTCTAAYYCPSIDAGTS